MYILPYSISHHTGELKYIVHQLKNKSYTLFDEEKLKYISKNIINTQLSKNIILRFNKDLQELPKYGKYVNTYSVLKIKIIKPYANILLFINKNNKHKIDKELHNFSNQIKNYKIIDISTKFQPLIPHIKSTLNKINKLYTTKVKAGTIVYKSMPIIKETYNVSKYELRSAWFGTYETALKYTDQVNRNKNVKINKVYKFMFKNDIELINLMIFNNLHKISKLLKSKIVKSLSNNDISSTKDNIKDLNILKILTGYEITYKEQLNAIKLIHPVFKRKIEHSEVEILNTFYNHNRKNRSKKIRYKIEKTYHSDLFYDMNRISLGTELDRSLINILQKNYKTVKGYIANRVPSIWEFGRYNHNTNSNVIPTLDEEIGLYIQKDIVERLN